MQVVLWSLLQPERSGTAVRNKHR